MSKGMLQIRNKFVFSLVGKSAQSPLLDKTIFTTAKKVADAICQKSLKEPQRDEKNFPQLRSQGYLLLLLLLLTQPSNGAARCLRIHVHVKVLFAPWYEVELSLVIFLFSTRCDSFSIFEPEYGGP